jgi:hypothetical protein
MLKSILGNKKSKPNAIKYRRENMSEEINNREYRQKVIRELISELHAGKQIGRASCRERV